MRWHRPPAPAPWQRGPARASPVRVLPVALALMLGATLTPGRAGAQGTTAACRAPPAVRR